MSISFIVAYDRNKAIGRNNKLPWRLPADLANVKNITMGHTLVMGRKTYESIGKPLPGRKNVVVTRDPDFSAEGVETVHSVEETLEKYGQGELFIFGGTEIFKLFLPHADKLFITRIDEEFEADTYFPDMNMEDWNLVSELPGVKDEKNPYSYSFLIYVKKH